MNWLLPSFLLSLMGYICGATPFGYIAAKLLRGIDIREHGSRNIGATNVIRVCGKGIGIPVFLLDVGKGWLPAWFAQHWLASHGADVTTSTLTSILAGIAAVLGHNFTFWLKGQGGKGIATSAGALLGTAPIALGVALLVWLVLVKVTRYVSLASMGAGLAVPVTMVVMMARSGLWNGWLLGFGVVLATLAIVRHKANIQRLLTGTENRVGAVKAAAPTTSTEVGV
jgi:acyl phosphate:glycerol-3-phosphate acyltransferase